MNRLVVGCLRLASTSARSLRQNALEEGTVGQFITTPQGEGDLEGARTRLVSVEKEMDESKQICVKGFNRVGFRLATGEFLFGPIAVFPRLALSWRICTADEITEESLEFFTLLEPPPDLLIIGVGDREKMDKTRRRLAPWLRETNIRHEILVTEDAINVYNIAAHEGRYAAAALFPPDVYQVGRRDLENLHNLVGFDPLQDGQWTYYNPFMSEEPDKRVTFTDRVRRGDLARHYIHGGIMPPKTKETEDEVLDKEDEEAASWGEFADAKRPTNIFREGKVAAVSKPRYGSVLKEEREAARRVAAERAKRALPPSGKANSMEDRAPPSLPPQSGGEPKKED